MNENDIAEWARRLGKRGGDRTKQRGRDYYVQLGKLGMAKRWGPRSAAPEPRQAESPGVRPRPPKKAREAAEAPPRFGR